jgi:hypothetical protein
MTLLYRLTRSATAATSSVLATTDEVAAGARKPSTLAGESAPATSPGRAITVGPRSATLVLMARSNTARPGRPAHRYRLTGQHPLGRGGEGAELLVPDVDELDVVPPGQRGDGVMVAS